MYIAIGYLETKFNKIFKKGEVVPDEIAEHYMSRVIKKGDGELLVETPTEIEVIVEPEEELPKEELPKKEKQPKKKAKK